MAEFAINNAVHALTGHTPFFVNAMRHPRLPSTLGAVASSISGGGYTVALEQPQNTADTDLSAATTRARTRARTRQGDVSVPDTDTVRKHEQATPASSKDNVSVRSTDTSKTHVQSGPVARTSDVSMPGIDTEKLHAQAGPAAITISGFGASKLAPRFIAPFMVAERHGSAYTLELPSDMRLHPMFYIGRLKPYVQPESSSRDDSRTTTRGATSASPQASSPSPGEGELGPTPQHGCGLSGFGHVSLLQVQLLLQRSDLKSLNAFKSLHASVERLKTVANLGLTI
ncbi:LOW QUALITY PROTEIN: Pol Polyprotein [Phytophthora megakarya]|uniref:Pol Polyprotein n=1 Tax=Phytophthora megakarya TaxID=4795 RepID=A0A225UWL9_9STRA|nr:LOW QUALITY PROTEIN: Pol Polyprotein [Phytophthora megakarya]